MKDNFRLAGGRNAFGKDEFEAGTVVMIDGPHVEGDHDVVEVVVPYHSSPLCETAPVIKRAVILYILDSWHYVTYRASVTIFTNAEWDNNRSLGEDDSNYRHGKTYAFLVVDENTISSEEKVSSNSYIVNFFTRFNPSDYRTKDIFDEEYSPNTLIVMYDTEVGKEPLVEAVKSSNAEIIYDYNLIPGMAIRISI